MSYDVYLVILGEPHTLRSSNFLSQFGCNSPQFEDSLLVISLNMMEQYNLFASSINCSFIGLQITSKLLVEFSFSSPKDKTTIGIQIQSIVAHLIL